MKKITEIDFFCFYSNETVFKAMQRLNNKDISFLIIVNKKKELLGTITDGDIRRHILKGNSLNQSISLAMNKKPIFSYERNEIAHKKKLLSSQSILKFLPIVTETKKVKYILVYEKEEINNIVLIMAGGFGKRLGKKTQNIPKPLLKVGNKTILDIILKKIYEAGFNKVLISTHYLHKKIKDHIEKKYKKNNIRLIYEKYPMGTAGCISMIKENFKNLIVINGDVVSNINVRSLMTYHYDTKNDITLTVAKYSYKIPFGLVELDKSYQLVKINEKPSLDYNVVSGIYCIKKSICDLISNEHLDMTTLISNSIKLKKKIGVFPIYEYWQDVGNPDDLIKAKNDFKK